MGIDHVRYYENHVFVSSLDESDKGDINIVIRCLYETGKRGVVKETLACKWAIGREIYVARGQQDETTLRELQDLTGISAARVQQEPNMFRELEGLIGINNGELVRYVQFFLRMSHMRQFER